MAPLMIGAAVSCESPYGLGEGVGVSHGVSGHGVSATGVAGTGAAVSCTGLDFSGQGVAGTGAAVSWTGLDFSGQGVAGTGAAASWTGLAGSEVTTGWEEPGMGRARIAADRRNSIYEL